MAGESSRGQVFQIQVKWNVADFGELIPAAVEATSIAIRDRSRADMGSHFDRFGKKGLTTRTTKVQGGYRIGVYQKPGFLKVFEYGGVSVGKPMLWIPHSPDARGIRAKRYRKVYREGLIRPRGKNVLIGAKDKEVKYIGVPRVVNKPRFHIRQIAVEEANKLVAQIGNAAKNAKASP